MKGRRHGFALRHPKPTRAYGDEGPLAVRAAGTWPFFARGAAAVTPGMHPGLSTATSARRDLGIVRTGVIPIGRPIGGLPALVETVAGFTGGERRG